VIASVVAFLAVLPAPSALPPPSPGSSRPSPDLIPGATYGIRVFRDSDGLPQNSIQTIAVDQQGQLWVGTQDGAAFYDGRRWTAVDLPSRARSNYVRVVLPTADGSLWFGTQNAGLCRLQAGRWDKEVLLEKDGRAARVNAILETQTSGGARTLWVGTHDQGLARLDADGWTFFDSRSGLPSDRIWSLCEAPDETGQPALWVGTQGGLAILRGSSPGFEVRPSFPRESVNSMVATTLADGSRALWAGTYGSGLARLSGGVWRTFSTRDGLPSSYVTSLAWKAAGPGGGELWVGTDGGGVACFRGDQILELDARHGLPGNGVYALLVTTAAQGVDAVWVGTRNGGLARVIGGRWQVVHPVPRPAPVPVTSIVEMTPGGGSPVLYLGTDGFGLASVHEGRWVLEDSSTSPLPNDSIVCLGTSEGADGPALWVGTRNGGVARRSGSRWDTFTRASGALPSDLVQCVLGATNASGTRTVWIGTRTGMARYADGRWSLFGKGSGLPNESVLALAETKTRDGNRQLWAGTGAGLARLNAEEFTVADLPESIRGLAVQSLLAAREASGAQVLWIGTESGGAAVLHLDEEPPSCELLNENSTPRLPKDVIYNVLQDRAGRIYLLTNRGVIRLTPTGAARGQGPRWEATTFTVEDGLPLNQCTRGTVDSTGRVWVGTVAGAAVLDPAAERPDHTTKRLSVKGFVRSVEGDRTPLAGEARHEQRNLIFEYRLLSFYRESDTSYRSQVVGSEPVPGGWQREGTRELLGLPPGSYTFRVWGRDWAGNVSGPVDLPFVVNPAWWATWWAELLFALAAVTLLLTAHLTRVRASQRREERLQELTDARTRELMEANQLLEDLSYLDPLTGVGNRRRFEERLDHEWRRGTRSRAPLSLIMVDIDFFKAYNDTYGHQKGDDCLKRVAQAIVDGLSRSGDSAARYGGEEFVVVLPATDRRGATKVADSLRLRVQELQVPHSASRAGRVVTISCGVATLVPETAVEAAELIRLADEALYRAKQAGRNRTRSEHGEPRSSVTDLAATPADPSSGSSGPIGLA
jgi:diguanylate cyclase (GGDEF)-like protein